MKATWTVVGVLAIGLVTGIVALNGVFADTGKAGAAAARGEQVTITGRFSCTFCTLAHPDKPCTKDCCTKCIQAGDPPSLSDAEGNRYLLLTGEMGKPLMTPARADLLGGEVTVKGLLVKTKTLQAIYVDSMEKAGAKVSLTGRLSCTFCTLAHPDKTCSKECCTTCLKAGDPPSLTDAAGTSYLLVSGEQGKPLMTPARMDLLGGDVTVKGLIVRVKGMQAVYVDEMEKAAGK